MKILPVIALLFASAPCFAETTCSSPRGQVSAGQSFTNEKGENCVCVLHVHGPSQTRWTSISCAAKLQTSFLPDQQDQEEPEDQ